MIATFTTTLNRKSDVYTIGTATDAAGKAHNIKLANMPGYNALHISTTHPFNVHNVRRVVQCEVAPGSEWTAVQTMIAAAGLTLTAIDSAAIGHGDATPRALRTF